MLATKLFKVFLEARDQSFAKVGGIVDDWRPHHDPLVGTIAAFTASLEPESAILTAVDWTLVAVLGAEGRRSSRPTGGARFAFTCHLQEAGVCISMDGRGRSMDNSFVEWLRRSLKYEAIYLHEILDGFTERRVIGKWVGLYNNRGRTRRWLHAFRWIMQLVSRDANGDPWGLID